jgi:hypothetical protein
VADAKAVKTYGLDSPIVMATVSVDPPTAATQPESQPAEPPTPVHHVVLVTQLDEAVYAMAPGGGTICEVDPHVLADLKAELMDAKVTRLDSGRAKRFTVTADSSFEFHKIAGQWKLSGEPSFPTDAAKIEETLGALRDLRAARYVRYGGADLRSYGLDKPAVIVEAEQEDGPVVRLSVSSQGPAGSAERFAVVSSAAGRVFVIAAEDAGKFQRRMQDYQRPG